MTSETTTVSAYHRSAPNPDFAASPPSDWDRDFGVDFVAKMATLGVDRWRRGGKTAGVSAKTPKYQ